MHGALCIAVCVRAVPGLCVPGFYRSTHWENFLTGNRKRMITQEKWRDENEEVRGHIIFSAPAFLFMNRKAYKGTFFVFEADFDGGKLKSVAGRKRYNCDACRDYFWRSCHSSCQAIWMASSLLSLDVCGSPANPGSSVTHLCMSVKRTVSGSTSGNLSARPMAMSSRLSQSKVCGIAAPQWSSSLA